jgi:hypothetical protein
VAAHLRLETGRGSEELVQGLARAARPGSELDLENRAHPVLPVDDGRAAGRSGAGAEQRDDQQRRDRGSPPPHQSTSGSPLR